MVQQSAKEMDSDKTPTEWPIWISPILDRYYGYFSLSDLVGFFLGCLKYF